MSDIDIILKYFPKLNDNQIKQFSELGPLYESWNEKINVVSRKDIEHIYLRHILHSMAIAAYTSFPSGSTVLDVGTGGGLPGIPLAILYPDVKFTLVYSIGKKIKVVKEISQKIKCSNITAINARAETLNTKFDYVVSRAVTNMPKFVEWVNPLIRRAKEIPPSRGIIALKGGNLRDEMGPLFSKAQIIEVSDYFNDDFFNSKLIVHLPVE